MTSRTLDHPRRLTNPVREARIWLAVLLAIAAAALLALLDRFDLVGTSSNLVLGFVAQGVSIAAAVGFLFLTSSSFRRAKETVRPVWPGIVAGVLGVASVGASVVAVVLGTAQVLFGFGVLLPAALLLVAFFVLFVGERQSLSETTHTQISGWLFVLPAFLLMLVWIYLPAVNAFWISLFRDFNYLGTATFVGAENYLIAFRDPLFIRSLVNTAWFVVGTVPASIILGVFIAILLNEPIKARGLFRLAYFLPYITALTAAAAVWMWIFNPGLGLLNYVLGLENFRWLSNPTGIFAMALAPLGITLSGYAAGPSVALVSIMVMSIWNFLGYNVVIFLAGLQSISKEYYEAATIDGANWWQQLRWITWPLLAPTTFFVLIISLIGSLNVFTQILIMTPTGGVLNDTLSVVMYLYQKGFRDFDFGYASALAFILFVFTLLLTLGQRRLFSARGGDSAADS